MTKNVAPGSIAWAMRPSMAIGPVRTGLWLALCGLQAAVVTWLFELPYWFKPWQNPFWYMRQGATWAMIAAGAFAVIVWPRRAELARLWQDSQREHDWRKPLAANLALFAGLALASLALSRHMAGLSGPPVGLLSAYTAVLAATVASLLRIDVPLGSALRIARPFAGEIAAAGAAGFLVLAIGLVALHGWEYLASGTLLLTHAILSIYERDLVVDTVARTIRIGDFGIEITENCSGYEGIGLVVAFVSIYLWAFRDQLRFPRAFLLYPVGIAAIWLLNSLRIALLASLGAHVSADMAVKGFHSQAGWIAFLIATLGLMAAAQSSALLADRPDRAPARRMTVADRLAAGLLAPFMALMLASMALAAIAPYDRPLYALKVAAVLAALWLFRDVYRGASASVPLVGVVAGLAVGAAWIATDPNPAGGGALAAWLVEQGPVLAAAWLVWRCVGACLTVPIAEELAFRGFLHRWLIDRDFERVGAGQASLLALVVSSLLFGLMHERWLAGTLAGVVFALVMYRTRNLAGPIVAHMTANALICGWALLFRQWSLM